MRAVALDGGTLSVETLDDPSPRTGEIMLAPHYCGICGSDLHLREVYGQAPVRPGGRIVMGHEYAGEIVDIGPRTATDLSVGDLVSVFPFVETPRGHATIGTAPDHPGGLAELSVVEASRAKRLPEGVPARLGALCEPLAVSIHALGLAAPAGPLVVVGAGPVGLGIVAAAAIEGRGPVVAVEPSPPRRAMAESLGADLAVAPGDPLADVLADVGFTPGPISALAEGEPAVASILECVGRPDVVTAVIAGAPNHSRIVLAGACMQEISFNPLPATLAELDISFALAYTPAEFRAAALILADHPSVLEPLITDVRPLEGTEAAFDDLAHDPTELKVLIRPQD